MEWNTKTIEEGLKSAALYTSAPKGKEKNIYTADVYDVWEFIYNVNEEWIRNWRRCRICHEVKHCITGKFSIDRILISLLDDSNEFICAF